MSGNPFELPGEWLRAQLHAHSTESDGDLPPTELAAAYEDIGFDVLAITDHWLLTEVPSTERLTMVRGAELTFDLARPDVGEILVFGIDEIPDDPGGDRENWYANEEEHWFQRTFPTLSDGGRWAESRGGVAYVAHPYWSGLDAGVIAAAEHVAGLEVFNGTAELECGRGDSSMAWDSVLETGRRPFAIATDDAHVPLHDIGHAWTWIRAAERSESAVVEALRSGAAYGSEGPVLRDVARDGVSVEVACSPARAVLLQMEHERGCSVTAGERGLRWGEILQTDDDGLITRARVDSPWPDPAYIRLRVVDAAGRSAWTNCL